jgi:hypothetical protein
MNAPICIHLEFSCKQDGSTVSDVRRVAAGDNLKINLPVVYNLAQKLKIESKVAKITSPNFPISLTTSLVSLVRSNSILSRQ